VREASWERPLGTTAHSDFEMRTAIRIDRRDLS